MTNVTNSNLRSIIEVVIKYQESIIGPLAWSEAGKVSGLSVKNQEISVTGDSKKVLELLVKQYETLFGQASVEACKDAIRPLLPKMEDIDLPKILL